MALNSDSDMYERTAFSGRVEIDGEEHSVSFSVFAGADCDLKIDLEPVPAEIYVKLAKCMGEPGASGKEISLTGQADNGDQFESDTISVVGTNSGSNGHQCRLSHRSAIITKKAPNDACAEKPYARLWLRGFQSFRNPAIQTKLGQLSVFGDHKNVTKDSVSGNITIQADTVKVDGDWFSKADDFLTFLMCGLGFVHGGRLQTPRLDQVYGSEWKSTFYSG
ncbi:MAG TPA: hypothetical protein DD827_03695, partial [Gammaproteobacteria bacterium]|nr:hypothetical protein [Gammaproteobacteria bacterium]